MLISTATETDGETEQSPPRDHSVFVSFIVVSCSATCLSLIFATAKLLSTRYSPATILIYRSMFQVLVPLVVISRLWSRQEKLVERPYAVRFLFVRGILSPILVVSLYSSFALLPLGVAVALHNLSPVPAAFFSICFLGETFDGKFLVAVIISLSAGVVLLGKVYSLSTYDSKFVGIVVGLFSMIVTALYYSVVRLTNGTNEWLGVFSCGVGNIVGCFLIVLSMKLSIVPKSSFDAFLLVSIGIAQVSVTFALTKVTQRESSFFVLVVLLLEPVLAFVWQWVIFGDAVDVQEIAGMVLIVLSVLGTSYHKSTREKAPTVLFDVVEDEEAEDETKPLLKVTE